MVGVPANPRPATLLKGESGSAKGRDATGDREHEATTVASAAMRGAGGFGHQLRFDALHALGKGGIAEQGQSGVVQAQSG
jgi:hypothetical protein